MTTEELKQILNYDPKTGVFRWKALPHKCASNIEVGDVAGFVEKTGYRRIRIRGKMHMAHRLAWLHYYEEWPEGKMDHRDGSPDNNAIANLRIATPHQNSANRGCHTNNFLGIKGVRLHENGLYQARIYLNGKHKSLGCYKTAEEAQEAYRIAAVKAFGNFARMS